MLNCVAGEVLVGSKFGIGTMARGTVLTSAPDVRTNEYAARLSSCEALGAGESRRNFEGGTLKRIDLPLRASWSILAALNRVIMANVYVEPCPKGRPEGSSITHYVLEYAHGVSVDSVNHYTQASAIQAAKRLGHNPLVARVRNTNKGNPDHWRAA
ncbi:hypothetical protein Y027_6299 [Burkholderia pseudomallei TSV5]|nr:hypothetical protein Y025_6294 [Burkholderia pseudomallei TSV32]KGX64026.1 hypothetical protein Y027_6299 [Burkholderia pseudomallei TSV5]